MKREKQREINASLDSSCSRQCVEKAETGLEFTPDVCSSSMDSLRNATVVLPHLEHFCLLLSAACFNEIMKSNTYIRRLKIICY